MAIASGTADQGTARRTLVIRETIPGTARPREIVVLLGSGFGRKKDTLMLGKDKIPAENIGRWDDARIEFALPGTVQPGTYPLYVTGEGNTAEVQISVSGPQKAHGSDEIPADIVSDIWIDDPAQKGYRLPPTGYFIQNKRYYFFFEFAVPPGTPSWGRTQFRAQFFIDGGKEDERSFLPGSMNGNNYGVFEYTFKKEKDYTIGIRGLTTKTMKVRVGKPKGA